MIVTVPQTDSLAPAAILIGKRHRVEFGDIEALAESIAEVGLINPITVTPEGRLISGERRLRAIQILGWDNVLVRVLDIDAIVRGELAENDMRKDFTASERVAIGRTLEEELGDRRGQRTDIEHVQKIAQVAPGEKTREIAAERAGFGNAETYRQAKTVVDLGSSELVSAMDSGRISVSAAAAIATVPQPEQREIVALDDAEIKRRAKEIRDRETQQRREANAIIAAENATVPEGKFGTIVIDPPWPMQKIDRDVRPNQVAFDYPVMNEDELTAFGATVEAVAAEDCHMFMWTTQKFLPLALRLIGGWNFRYVLTMVWHKAGGFQPIGLPQYNCEFVVYARRGSPSFIDTKAFPCCFEAPRREHSRKPDEFYELISRVTGGERIDIFSREARDGFTQFGNETEKFAGAA